MDKDSYVYRGSALTHWKDLVAVHDLAGMRDLRRMRRRFDEQHAEPPLPVTSFSDLFLDASFLSVMNKKYTLLYRGQQAQGRLKPTLFRSRWTRNDGDVSWSVPLEGDERKYYWESLPMVERMALDVTSRHGLPRWRHFEEHAPARWAMVQHYELWPTPMLDFTTSLRVAASFALGVSTSSQEGYVHVVCVPRVRSDIMDLERDDDERISRVLALRLNSVCPPSARRTHLQEGVLMARYPVLEGWPLDIDDQDFSSLVIATFHLADNQGTFWNDDFPKHTEESLLPSSNSDPLLKDLREAMLNRFGSVGQSGFKSDD